MKSYIVLDENEKVQGHGICQDMDFESQAQEGQHVIEGKINDHRQKVVDGKVVDKTPEEIEADRPPRGKPEDEPIIVSKKDWQELQDRLSALEEQINA